MFHSPARGRHRTLIFRKLKGLEDAISVSVVDPHMAENGWEFHDRDGGTSDHLGNVDFSGRSMSPQILVIPVA